MVDPRAGCRGIAGTVQLAAGGSVFSAPAWCILSRTCPMESSSNVNKLIFHQPSNSESVVPEGPVIVRYKEVKTLLVLVQDFGL